jgi:outer membrane protein
MRKSLVGLLVAALTIPAVVAAQTAGHMDTPWTVRGGALYIAPTGSESETLGAKVGSDFTMEIDISRKLSPIFALELVLATAAHEVYIEDAEAGRVSLGSVHILPPSLMLQAHLPTSGKAHPYIGAGINYTMIYDKTGILETPAGLGTELDLSDSFGWVAQAGLDYDIGARGLFNVDVKYVSLKTDVSLDGDEVDTIDVNPILVRVGFGIRF